MRSKALDALRGVALLGMALSGLIPWGTLPAWMYHAQLPPPTHKLSPSTFGITWVDLVFPLFLFALGAALPLSIEKRREAGASRFTLAVGVVWRFASLTAFAMVAQAIRPAEWGKINDPTTLGVCLLLFVLAVLAWARFPLPAASQRWATIGSAIAALALLAICTLHPFPNGVGFGFNKFDVILLILANTLLFGGLLVVFTGPRNTPLVAAIATVITLGIFLGSAHGGVAKAIADWTPWKEVYRFELIKYLAVAAPGIWAGTLLRSALEPDPRPRERLIAWTGWVVAIGLCILLLNRNLNGAFLMTLLAGGVFLKLPRVSRPVRLALAGWGLCLVGLLVESVGGGIRKDPATLSYLILAPGISLWLLAAWDHTESAGRFNSLLRWTADVGANPMLGYIAITSLVPGVFRLTQIQTFINNAGWQPWGIASYALLQTLFVGLVCVIATRNRLFLRT